MKLYELTSLFSELFSQFDYINEYEPDTNADGQPIDGDGNIIENVDAYKDKMLSAWFDTLEGIEGEFDEKAENIAVYIKSMLAMANTLKAEEYNLEARRKRCEKSAERMKAYLLNSMQELGRKRIDMPKAVISTRNNAPSLVVDDELSFIEWAQKNNDDLLKYELPKIKKNDTKALYKKGEKVPFVHLEQKTSLIIK